ncbi:MULTISPECIES: hypothetical protein [Phyllobacteriaceae]|jgi:hypothetical protein|nr:MULTISPECIES: hypothetical protein [Mesorhizobium]MBN9236362.1 hypothetical protein [Mesorhizobium sp.]MDQ0327735.1 hypothetical protein [Mesorhizobium sp. YL-MeA3-2017]
MRSPAFARLAGMVVAAFMSFVQAPMSQAAQCGEGACSLQAREGDVGNLHGAASLQRLAQIGLDLSIGCPRGFLWDGEDCVLRLKNRTDRAECPDGMRWDGEDCVRDRKARKRGSGGCVFGYHWNGEECVPDRQGKKKNRICHEGTEFANGKCRKSEFPPVEGEGGAGDDGFSCSHNDHLENGRCVPCKEGFHVEGDECVAD